MRKSYIEVLRICAALAVVMIHITMTEVVNSSISQIGEFDYAIYSAGYTLVRWAVPVFIMISGSLLLQPEKKISAAKLKAYIKRMLTVLLLFGTVYAVMEIVFTDGVGQWYLIFPRAVLRVFQNKSWDHLWYLYLLIGLYLLTPFTKAAIEKIEANYLWHLIIILYLINYVRPAVNLIFNLEVSNLWIAANGYYGYYLLGYYLTTDNNVFYRHRKKLYVAGVAAILFMILYDTVQICGYSTYSSWIRDANPLVPIVAVAIYVFVQDRVAEDDKIGKIGESISDCSFGIYLIHPFFINILYKLIGFTPRSIPVVLGIAVLYIVVFLLSWGGTILMKRLPVLKDLI